MEADRAQADLGEAVDAELSAENLQKRKEPRKRFIGRKEAAERAEKKGNTNGTIEDSGAIQGVQRHIGFRGWNTDILQLHHRGRWPER